MRTMTAVAGFLGLSGVALGAFGAHALKNRLADRGMTDAWDTAVQYHLIHAVAFFALVAFCASKAGAHSTKLLIGAWAWLAGVCLFSGSLYLLALGGPRWLGPITPIGGLAFLTGWACLLIPERETK